MKREGLWGKDFTLVVIGQIISLFGNGILRFALPLYLLNLTQSSAIFGIVSAISFLPMILIMPVGGIIADRKNKKNIMVILDFLTGGLMLFFYFTMNIISVVPLVIATMLILYSIGALYQPTVQASVPALLSEEVLTQGNGIVSSITALANLLAPVIGGMVFASFGITPIILVSIICFIASAILELFIYIPSPKQVSGESMLLMVKEDTEVALNYIFKEKPIIFKVMIIVCVLNAFISALIIISLPVLITTRLSLSEEMYGFSQGILAFGGLVGGMMAGVLGEKLHISKLNKCILFVALSLLPMSVSMIFKSMPMVSYILILVSAFFAMCASTLASIMIITFIQSQTSENIMGKIMAFVMTISMFAVPLGQAGYGIVFQYLVGYEIFIILGVVIISLLVGIYAKKILN